MAEVRLRARVFALSAVMAGIAVGQPASAQIVIGDDRPSVVVDQAVLDRLGPPASLPDMLLGRAPPRPAADPSQPPPSLTAPHRPVALHKPMHKVPVKHVHKDKPAPVATKLASAPPVPVPMVETRGDSGKSEATSPAQEPAKVDLPATPAPPPQAAKVEPPPPQAAKVEPPPPQAAKAEPTPPPPAANPEPAQAAKAEPPPPPPQLARTEAPPAKPEPPPAPALAEPPPAPPLAAAPPPPAAPQEAKLPAGTGSADGASSILFEKEQARLSDNARAALIRLAERLTVEPTVDVQLLAYAEGDDNSASKARRLSLSRALQVRSFLIDQGVRSTRIEVRALGNKISDGPSDRVDLVLQKH